MNTDYDTWHDSLNEISTATFYGLKVASYKPFNFRELFDSGLSPRQAFNRWTSEHNLFRDLENPILRIKKEAN